MKKLPVGTQQFKDLIENGCLYVDKTPYLLKLTDATAPVFLSRPRRFGKTLMLNTFKALFDGDKALFAGTYAHDHWDFEQTHPVIQLDLSLVSSPDVETVSQKLLFIVKQAASQLGLALEPTPYPDFAFNDLIHKAAKHKRVVLLVDEYDSPLLENLDNPQLNEIKKLVHSFLRVIKANEAFLQFTFITGMSKYTHAGVFSGLNHLDDITLNSDYAAVLGFTESEIRNHFKPQLAQILKTSNASEDEFWALLHAHYSGYSWDGQQVVFNPFSILKFFANQGQFLSYWQEPVSPAFVSKYADSNKLTLTNFEHKIVSRSFLNMADFDAASPENFLTQYGYLTIKGKDQDSYTLDFPNNEVRRSFCELILNHQYAVQDDDPATG